MAIRRKKKKVAVVKKGVSPHSALGLRIARLTAIPKTTPPAAIVPRTPSAVRPAPMPPVPHPPKRSMAWEEEKITTGLLEKAVAGTTATLDANRRLGKSALASPGGSPGSPIPGLGGSSSTGSDAASRKTLRRPLASA